jgi:hypothetical protein
LLLLQVLLADETVRAQLRGAIAIRLRELAIGDGLSKASLRLRQVGSHGSIVEAGQQIAALDPVANVYAHLHEG